MPVGTPGFNGDRFREAREARGLTASAVAELLGVTRSSISLYETGNTTPQPELLNRISSVLNFPAPFFLRPSRPNDEGAVYYRSMSAATKTARIRAEHRLEWFQDIVQYLRGFVRFPDPHIPPAVYGDPQELTTSIIEAAASDARRFWGLGDGPISNVALLLENNGIMLSRIQIGAATLDAYSVWDSANGTPFVILGADKGSAVRSRYDVAHELGHLILHRKISEASLRNVTTHRLLEDQAHRFASAFLVPAGTFADDYYAPTLDSFRALKPKWLVSIGMQIFRAHELNLMTDEQATRLWINYNRRGWRRHEPLDDQLKIEEPRLVRRAFEAMIEEGNQLRSQITSALALPPQDIEEIAGLPWGYLDENSPYVWATELLGGDAPNLS